MPVRAKPTHARCIALDKRVAEEVKRESPGSNGTPTAPESPKTKGTSRAWQAPSSVDVANYVVYRDGALFAVTPPGVTSYTDTTVLPGTNTRYHVALLDNIGVESNAASADPSMVRAQGGP